MACNVVSVWTAASAAVPSAVSWPAWMTRRTGVHPVFHRYRLPGFATPGQCENSNNRKWENVNKPVNIWNSHNTDSTLLMTLCLNGSPDREKPSHLILQLFQISHLCTIKYFHFASVHRLIFTLLLCVSGCFSRLSRLAVGKILLCVLYVS